MMAAVFAWLWRRHGAAGHRDGELFCAFLASHGAVRLTLLPLRADASRFQMALGATFLVAGLARKLVLARSAARASA